MRHADDIVADFEPIEPVPGFDGENVEILGWIVGHSGRKYPGVMRGKVAGWHTEQLDGAGLIRVIDEIDPDTITWELLTEAQYEALLNRA